MTNDITTMEQLRELLGEPVSELVLFKSTPVLTAPLRKYIELSPFVCLATYGADGTCDLSPRGDPPGFVKVLDEKTLFLPERPGNNRLDCLTNIIQQPQLSLLFMIPGTLETVRVNGTGVVTTDPALRERCAVKGRIPEIGIRITVGEALGHCSKAFRRSKLWEADYVRKTGVPGLAEMMKSHLDLDTATSEMLDAGIAQDVENRMY